jgi:hypothetical protein
MHDLNFQKILFMPNVPGSSNNHGDDDFSNDRESNGLFRAAALPNNPEHEHTLRS